MAKQRALLDEIMAAQLTSRATVGPELAPVVPEPPSAKERISRPHVSLYLDKEVQREIKRIGIEYDRKPHDLYLEGVDLMLKQYGRRSIAELTKAEGKASSR